MEHPGEPHVRMFEGRAYVERVPNYWIDICAAEWFQTFNETERRYMIEKAIKHGLEKELPPR